MFRTALATAYGFKFLPLGSLLAISEPDPSLSTEFLAPFRPLIRVVPTLLLPTPYSSCTVYVLKRSDGFNWLDFRALKALGVRAADCEPPLIISPVLAVYVTLLLRLRLSLNFSVWFSLTALK